MSADFVTSSQSVASAARGTVYFVSGTNTVLSFFQDVQPGPIFLTGPGDGVAYTGDSFLGPTNANLLVFDNSSHSEISLASYTGKMTLFDFRSTDNVTLFREGYSSPAAAFGALQPDGQGGSLLPLAGGGNIDFVGDKHLTQSQFSAAQQVGPGM
jgi:hypothetical protein